MAVATFMLHIYIIIKMMQDKNTLLLFRGLTLLPLIYVAYQSLVHYYSLLSMVSFGCMWVTIFGLILSIYADFK